MEKTIVLNSSLRLVSSVSRVLCTVWHVAPVAARNFLWLPHLWRTWRIDAAAVRVEVPGLDMYAIYFMLHWLCRGRPCHSPRWPVICLRHTGGQACRSRLLPYYPRTAPDKHAVRRRDQRGEARRPSSSTSPACAQQRHHRLSTVKSATGFSCPDLGTLCSLAERPLL